MTTLAVIEQVSGWWDNLDLARQVFYGLGITAAVVSVVLAVLSFIGLEHHDVVDAASADFDHGGGGIFSVKPLTGFFLGFGWAGGMLLDFGVSLFVAIFAAAIAGAMLMALVVAMYRAMRQLRSDGTMRISDAVGAVGTVYVTLPPNKKPGGQVIVTVSGRQETLAALCAAERPVPSGDKVKVLSVVDGRTLLVEVL